MRFDSHSKCSLTMRKWSGISLAVISKLLLACGPVGAGDEVCYAAEAWGEADALFLGDPHWVGADGASSIDLGHGRTLWLFADTWVDPSGRHDRQDAQFIRNSVAVQTGKDPSTSDMEFYWGLSANGTPKEFFAGDRGEWLWPGHGIRISDRVLVFFNRLRRTNEGLGFESVGWSAVMIENPDDAPTVWQLTALETPTNELGIILGFAGVLKTQEYLYAFGSPDPDKTHPIFAARWPLTQVSDANLDGPVWWDGRDRRWISSPSFEHLNPLFENGQAEMSVHFDANFDTFLAVQSVGFGAAHLAIRSALKITAGWTLRDPIYDPPEIGRPNAMIYAAKAHPHLSGADLVLTYANNSFEFSEQFSDDEIYYPRFVRLTRSCGR